MNKMKKKTKKKKKPSNMVTNGSAKVAKINDGPQEKVLSSCETADQNFYEKVDEVEVDETNIGDNMDMQEMLRMIEETFQEKFKNNWDRQFEEEKLRKVSANLIPNPTALNEECQKGHPL